jgi:hypothetical protein
MINITDNLKKLQLGNGLFLAAPSSDTGYNKVWVRDTIYAAIGMEHLDRQSAVKAMHGLLTYSESMNGRLIMQ